MRFFTLLIFVAVVCGVGFMYVKNDKPIPPEFRMLEVRSGDIIDAISASGTIEPVEVVDVGAQIVGRIRSFAPDINNPEKTVDFVSQVKAGEEIAKLDDLPYVNESEKAQSDLNLAKAEKGKNEVQLEQAIRDLKRVDKLRQTNASSENEYETIWTTAKVAKAEVEIAQARVEQAEIALKQAKINLDYATIRSPIDGVVLDRRVNVGQTVVAGLNAPSLFLIAKDLKKMQVWAAVNEADIGQVSIGQNVTFKVDAYPDRTFDGVVSQIRLNASTAHSVVTYGTIIDIDNSDGKLLPYMTANLQFEVAKADNAVLVPNQALRWKPLPEQIVEASRADYTVEDKLAPLPGQLKTIVEEPTIWVQAEPGFVRPVSVALGINDGVVTQIMTEELKIGEAVVVGVIPRKQQDFVSSFVSRVTKKNDE